MRITQSIAAALLTSSNRPVFRNFYRAPRILFGNIELQTQVLEHLRRSNSNFNPLEHASALDKHYGIRLEEIDGIVQTAAEGIHGKPYDFLVVMDDDNVIRDMKAAIAKQGLDIQLLVFCNERTGAAQRLRQQDICALSRFDFHQGNQDEIIIQGIGDPGLRKLAI
jgi:hypothetical protein